MTASILAAAHMPAARLVLAGVLAGALGAAKVDYEAFKLWRSAHDAVEYDWPTAAWRWFRGAVIGGVTASGVAALVG